jgi:hypothetical protein
MSFRVVPPPCLLHLVHSQFTPMPLSLTPQSLKRKLLQSGDFNIELAEADDMLTIRTPPTEIFSPQSPSETTSHLLRSSSPLRGSKSSSPTKTTTRTRTASILHSSTLQNPSSPQQLPFMSPLQVAQLYKTFTKRDAPFPLELLKPQVLSELFLKGRALERYFQRRHDGIIHSQTAEFGDESMNSGLRPVQRPFVRSSPPSVPFTVYLERLSRYCHPEPLHLLAIVAYSERLIKLHGLFVPPTGWHRFTVAAWIVAGKALLGDQYWTNLYWSRVAGISITEICSLESELVSLLNWRLQVPTEEITSSWYLVQL